LGFVEQPLGSFESSESSRSDASDGNGSTVSFEDGVNIVVLVAREGEGTFRDVVDTTSVKFDIFVEGIGIGGFRVDQDEKIGAVVKTREVEARDLDIRELGD